MLLPRLIWPIRLRRTTLLESYSKSSLSLGSRISLSSWTSCLLPQRALVKVQGVEAAPFLQGLITNDINPLVEDDRKSLYCAFLNTGGRVLFDAIISKTENEGEFLLDVDSAVSKLVKKHLSLYKVRRKISIKVMEDLNVHAVFQEVGDEDSHPEHRLPTRSGEPGSTFCNGGEVPTALSLPGDAPALPDPRVPALGYRLILPASEDPHQVLPEPTHPCHPSLFTQLRYRLGVPEGSSETPLGKALPLEYNLDYMNGVSFHKGCYIGQELTARTHHTGVIRKRILPLKLSQAASEDDVEQGLKNGAGKSVGKLIAVEGNLGLGVVRLKEGLDNPTITLGKVEVTVKKPSWWPKEGDNKQTEEV